MRSSISDFDILACSSPNGNWSGDTQIIRKMSFLVWQVFIILRILSNAMYGELLEALQMHSANVKDFSWNQLLGRYCLCYSELAETSDNGAENKKTTSAGDDKIDQYFSGEKIDHERVPFFQSSPAS